MSFQRDDCVTRARKDAAMEATREAAQGGLKMVPDASLRDNVIFMRWHPDETDLVGRYAIVIETIANAAKRARLSDGTVLKVSVEVSPVLPVGAATA